AEVRALAEAGTRARGATLYCTLEPCCHLGRTGPCVHRIVEAGVSRVVAAVEDPNPAVRGRGFAFLRERGVAVDVGLASDRAVTLNQPFFTLMREGRPFVVLKAATSLDGRIAAAPGRRTLLTSAAANRHAHRVRAEVDAIGVGSGTILSDDPELTARGAYRERPLSRVIFDRRLRTPPQARVLSTPDAGPVIIVTDAASAARADLRGPLEARGAHIEVAADHTLRAALRRLAERQIESLLLECGAAIHAAAWDEGLVDYVRLYVTPHVLGADAVPLLPERSFSTADLRDRRIAPLGPDVLIEGYVHGTH
ncbi:MAG TPA: bifunctional diaminohydroxyphosphoribosylaminopyrimidine deaminase/5-amino-6-(5-phosphoribosylamino)uracil reductase RibD, partial [Vicinamibacterales bacterium]|nr:bifunctional diaminohydroxyphosphoribosylaminopyrimidine deaminase/5-amino-6-(5-phosphoribosylamino)uracil reductase RibD [Vicinamibacterales bacterium]